MKTPVATCAICDEPILMEVSDPSDTSDDPRVRHEFENLAEAHMRSHPEAVQERFWLRRFLEDIPAGERAIAVKRVYVQLRSLWGDQDSRGVYTLEEALGTASVYRLWLSAAGCSYRGCRHGETLADAPPEWHGTSREWKLLATAVAAQCTCASTSPQYATCPAHQLLADPKAFNRLLFARRIAQRLEHEEFGQPVSPSARSRRGRAAQHASTPAPRPGQTR